MEEGIYVPPETSAEQLLEWLRGDREDAERRQEGVKKGPDDGKQ